MAQKTSINIKPCNLGSSSPHNKRSAEYLANIRKEKFYIRTDLMERNEMWVSSQLGDTSLTDYYNQIAAMVKEKTGRAMQTKDRERVNKKTGKVTIVRGSTPLKEGVVVIKESVGVSQPCRCSSTVTRDTTEYPATMPHGSPTCTPTSYGIG